MGSFESTSDSIMYGHINMMWRIKTSTCIFHMTSSSHIFQYFKIRFSNCNFLLNSYQVNIAGKLFSQTVPAADS